jgi:hypothetical protein
LMKMSQTAPLVFSPADDIEALCFA